MSNQIADYDYALIVSTDEIDVVLLVSLAEFGTWQDAYDVWSQHGRKIVGVVPKPSPFGVAEIFKTLCAPSAPTWTVGSDTSRASIGGAQEVDDE